MDTAREFLEVDPADLLKLMDKERILKIRTVMHEEFEEREDPHYLAALEQAVNGTTEEEVAKDEEEVTKDEESKDEVVGRQG